MQALVDPATGEQVTLSPNSNAAGNVSSGAAVQVITVADPVTGEPVQQMVQTVVDPSTGQTIQVPVQSNLAGGGGGGGNTQIVMVNNPVTGEQMQQVVQTVVDPTTGKTVQIPVDSSSNNGAAQIVTVTDPQTGQPVQQIVQTVIDPATGKPTQVMTPLSNTQNGLPTNDDSILDLYNGRGADLEETLRTIRSGKVTDEEVNKLMTVFHTSGVVSSAGGVTRLRKISDLRKTLEATNDAFDAAMEMAANRGSTDI